MPFLFKQPKLLPTPPGSPLPGTGTSRCSIEDMPPEIVIKIMGFLPSRIELISLGASSRYLAKVLSLHRIPILKAILTNILHPSNLDICLLTMGVIQVTREGEDVWQCLYALSQRPTVDTIRDTDTLCNMVDLAAYINFMVDIYAYPKHPNTFWRRALRKYANRWPDGCVPDGLVIIDQSTREDLQLVAARLWNVRDAALGYCPSAAPATVHSKGAMALFQREMFCAELKLRCDLVTGHELGIPEWMSEESPGDGVQSFLELL
ncbi:hypothetical protein TrVGV298_011991 [Trichoderma virens]|nr:hypothetical protein TrVGV298_011991 [Trichoderma virens]UKZ83826.1 hypothetical protein TrVFT333_011639 [Trichoderma virens FT-333]